MYHDKCTFWAPQNRTHTAAVRVEGGDVFVIILGEMLWGKKKVVYLQCNGLQG